MFFPSAGFAITVSNQKYRRRYNALPPPLGALLSVVGALTVYSAYIPATRAPILTAAVIEKFVIVGLIFFGPVKRTVAMTAVAALDGTLAILFVAYLAGLATALRNECSDS
jgi:hypothetical protein